MLTFVFLTHWSTIRKMSPSDRIASLRPSGARDVEVGAVQRACLPLWCAGSTGALSFWRPLLPSPASARTTRFTLRNWRHPRSHHLSSASLWLKSLITMMLGRRSILMVLYQNLILFNACIFNFFCEGGPNMSMSVLWAQFSSLFSFSPSNLIVAPIFTWACLPHRLCREEGLKGRGAHEEFTRRRLVVQPKSWKHFPSAWARVWRGGMLCQIFEFTTQRLLIWQQWWTGNAFFHGAGWGRGWEHTKSRLLLWS